MLNKIDIKQIVRNHVDTLKNDNTNRPDWDDYFTFILIPICITGGLLYFEVGLSEGAINIIITALSILVGLLFNVIVLIFDIIKRDASKRLKNIILKELLSNISFTILVSIITIIFTLCTFIENKVLQIVFSGLVYFLLTIFIFTVLMILKRMHRLFKNEIEEIEKTQEEIAERDIKH